MSPFVYPPLPHGVDAIRTIKIEPGDFSDPLICTLNPVAFGAKPKYVALSYTWGDPYPDNAALPTSPADSQGQRTYPNNLYNATFTHEATWPHNYAYNNAENIVPATNSTHRILSGHHPAVGAITQIVLPTITLDGSPFSIGHNLYLALLHLRSPTEPLTLWIDAVCINQNDYQERNSQVALMSFIYTRATAVITWLGVKEHYKSHLDPFFDPFRSMSAEWKVGQVQNLAATLANKTKHRFSLQPDHRVFSRIAESSYWTRLWVVQELCLPRVLFLVYGPDIWAYEDFLDWEVLQAARSKQPSPGLAVHQVVHEGLDAMLRLIGARAAKFSDAMMLENLLEVFSQSQCINLKDRVYGLLGLANDVHPISTSHETATQSAPEDGIQVRRGIRSLLVDYRLTFYDIWANVVELIYCQVKTVDTICSLSTTTQTPDSSRTSEEGGIPPQEKRYISIVRTSGVIQTALGQSVEEELTKSKDPVIPKPSATIKAIGYLRGQITELGPDFTSLIASARAQQDWVSLWTSHYHESASSLETLRRLDEEFMARLIAKDEKDMNLVREVRNPKVLGWPRLNKELNKYNPDPPDSASSALEKLYTEMWNEIDDNQRHPQTSPGVKSFLGTDHLMGLVPSAARAGDWIVRFWNCDAAIVVRPVHDTTVTPESSPTTTTVPSAFLLVGRADVTELQGWKAASQDESNSESDVAKVGKNVSIGSEALYFSLDFSTLQIITASIQT